MLKELSLIFIFLIILSGCANKFDPYKKGIAFNQGKPYRVPYGSYFGRKVDKLFYETLIENGISSCEIGDLHWISKEFLDKNIRPYANNKKSKKIFLSNDAYILLLDQAKIIFQENPYVNKIKYLAEVKYSGNKKVTYAQEYNRELNLLQTKYMLYSYVYPTKHNLAGCAKPMSKQEYEYYLHRENINSQQQLQDDYNTQKELDRMNYNNQQQLNRNQDMFLNNFNRNMDTINDNTKSFWK